MFEGIRGKHVVLVEDDDGSRAALVALFTACDAKVTACSTAEKGSAAVECDLPDVVISDIDLPGMDGYYLVQRLRDHEKRMGAPNVPAIALTGHDSETHKLRSVGEGFNAHVVKPFDPERLVSLVSRLLLRG